jgi:DNA primase
VGAVGTEGTVGTNGTGGTGGTGGAVGTGGTDGAGETDGAGGTLVSGEVSVRLQRVKVNSLKPFEALLLNYVVKYGELALYSEPEIIHVAEYIYNELSADAMLFETQLYEEMLEQAVKMCGREEFIAERYFLTHSDVEINKLAADMLSSRYKMSRRFETTEQEGLSEEEKQKREERCKMKWQHQLRRMIVHDIYLLKNEHLKLEIARLNGEILSLGDDFERSSELIARRLQLEAIVRELSKKLGERVITGV